MDNVTKLRSKKLLVLRINDFCGQLIDGYWMENGKMIPGSYMDRKCVVLELYEHPEASVEVVRF